MNAKEAKNLSLGLYRLFWKSGGSSLASVGQDESGNKWIAPINWITPGATDYWKHISRVEQIGVEE
jgi:hypothetical protein